MEYKCIVITKIDPYYNHPMYIHEYIYIYMCACVCVCMYACII